MAEKIAYLDKYEFVKGNHATKTLESLDEKSVSADKLSITAGVLTGVSLVGATGMQCGRINGERRQRELGGEIYRLEEKKVERIRRKKIKEEELAAIK